MDAPLSPVLLQEVMTAFEQIKNLPFPVHVSDIYGKFLFANVAAYKLFRLQDEHDLASFNIISCFEDPGERDHLLRQVRKVSAGQWVEDLTARLHIDDEHYKIRFASMPFFENQQLVAMLNIADSMSIIEWFAEFENELELGLFEVDKDFVIVDCNAALVTMMGFSNVKEILHKPVGDFLWNHDDMDELFAEIKEHKFLKKQQVKLRREDDAMVIVEMSCKAISWEEGQIARVKGIVRDITFEIIQQDNPIGLFLVTGKPNGEDIFSRVNDTFAHIHGYDSADDILGLPADTFQPKSNDNYLAALSDADKKKEPLLDHFMEIIDKHGVKHNVVVNASYVYGEEEKIRVGAVYDLTNHVGKHKHTLEAKISAVIHTYLATLNGIRDTLTMLIRAHGFGTMKDDLNIDREKAAAELLSRKRRLGRLLIDTLKLAEDRKITSPNFNKIQKYWNNLNQDEAMPEKDNASWSRRNLIEIRNSIEALKSVGLPREIIKAFRAEVNEMLRLSSIISLSISIDEINERLPDFLAFRDYLLRGETAQLEAKEINLIQILIETIQKLEGFASYHKVRVDKHFSLKENIVVKGNKIAITRAIHSLLHNAIKYSWSKREDQLPWVDIRVEKKQQKVEVIIENWGVPIRKEELENDFIFEFGKRGRESEDRGRAGTGIGLYDAREVLKENGGTLTITSEPTFGNRPDNYRNPFITRVFVTLPLMIEL